MELGLSISNLDKIKSRQNYNQYIIQYKSVQDVETYILQPTVLIETSYISLSFPIKNYNVNN